MSDKKIQNIIEFIEKIESLKSVTRTAYTNAGIIETTAEHSWRLVVLVDLISFYFTDLNKTKLLEMALIHDLAEGITGDISATTTTDKETKKRAEQKAFIKLTAILPNDMASNYRALFSEYQDGTTDTAKLVKALDKAETIIQHNQGKNPSGFNYAFNLSYGQQYFDSEILHAIRKVLDNKTKVKIESIKNTK